MLAIGLTILPAVSARFWARDITDDAVLTRDPHRHRRRVMPGARVFMPARRRWTRDPFLPGVPSDCLVRSSAPHGLLRRAIQGRHLEA